MRPKLSIVTPSLNQGDFIERTLRSVLDQGYENLEYIVVDGGSTDQTVEIIKRYEDRLAWWVSEKDNGQTEAINKGLERATGEIVAYINSDDYYLPRAFEAAVEALASSERSWAVGAARFVDPEGATTEVWRPEPLDLPRYLWTVGPFGWPQAASFWRRELFERHGGFLEDLHYVFDTEYGLRLAFAGELPELIDAEIAVRVVHPAAKSWDRSDFEREDELVRELYRPRLTAGEKLKLATVPLRTRVARLRGRLPEPRA